MDVFKILVTAVLAGTALYFISSAWAPLLQEQTTLSKATEEILLEAQSSVGESVPITLSAYKDQSLAARNYDNPTRNVAFACAGDECCPSTENCTENVSATRERIQFLENQKTTLSARCLKSEAGIHACTVYVGKEPAQVQLENTQLPEGILPTGSEISFTTNVRNTGEVDATSVVVYALVWGKQFESGKEIEKITTQEEQRVEVLPAGKTQTIVMRTQVNSPGTYRVEIIAEGQESGRDVETGTLTLSGEAVSTCAIDVTQQDEKKYDAFDDVCREKRYCTGCGFAFECRNAWESASTIEEGSYYDTQRGESTFTYLVTRATNGEC